MERIRKGGATARILDLHTLATAPDRDPELDLHPFFVHPRLNAGFFLKHSVRKHEREYLTGNFPVATKLILPMSLTNLSMGGHSVFVEEKGFEGKLRALLGGAVDSDSFQQDLRRLVALAQLPAFDPFLLADRFANPSAPEDGGADQSIAAGYFAIVPDEQHEMAGHVAVELGKITARILDEKPGAVAETRVRKLAAILLVNKGLEPLDFIRDALEIPEAEFGKALFGWRGLLYYHSAAQTAEAPLRGFVGELANLRIQNAKPDEMKALNVYRRSILSGTQARWKLIRSVLDQYDQASTVYQEQGDPSALRQFLLEAPTHFHSLGCELSAINHASSHWNFWLSGRTAPAMQVGEALEFFAEFQSNLLRVQDASPQERTA